MEGTQKTTTPAAEFDSSCPFNLKCKFCYKILSSRQNLREHLYIHTGEKPYACTEPGCGEAFRQGSLLSIHKKMHVEIHKGQKKAPRVVKRCSYPKLTQLISYHRHEEMDEAEREHWTERIGAENLEGLGKSIINAFVSLSNNC